jgi:hypothetical protein
MIGPIRPIRPIGPIEGKGSKMRIRLIDDDEPTRPVLIGESILHVRRIPESKEREIEARRRREYARAVRAGDQEAAVACAVAIDEDKIDYALTGWAQMDGNPPCTRENKLRLPQDVKLAVRTAMRNVTLASGDGDGNFASPSASSPVSAAGSETTPS